MKGLRVALSIAFVGVILVPACGTGTEQKGPASSEPIEITLTSQPDPPTTGETTFEAMVMEGGQPVTDADVSVELFMAAMPSMNMPEMKNSIALTHEGNGRYRGAGNVMMAGSWAATVSVKREGQEIANRKVPIVAK